MHNRVASNYRQQELFEMINKVVTRENRKADEKYQRELEKRVQKIEKVRLVHEVFACSRFQFGAAV
jgi:hypothetical protein